MKIRTGDTVIVLSGNEKGKTGKVSSVQPNKQTAVVEGVNVRKRHQKPTQSSPQGGVFEEPRPMPISKLGAVNPSKKGKSSRIGYEVDKNGKKKRVLRQAGNKEMK